MARQMASSAAAGAVRRAGGGDDGVNSVQLRGRVSAEPASRELPSGDEVVSLRLIVPRQGKRRAAASPTVDVIDVACWSATTRRTALRLTPGEVVEVTGALRRRFFRSGAAVQSRYEVEATRVQRRVGP